MHAGVAVAAAALAAMSLQECTDLRLVHPLSDASAPVAAPSLAGRWAAPDGGDEGADHFIQFDPVPEAPGTYRLWSAPYDDPESVEEVGTATLIRFRGVLLLDLAPPERPGGAFEAEAEVDAEAEVAVDAADKAEDADEADGDDGVECECEYEDWDGDSLPLRSVYVVTVGDSLQLGEFVIDSVRTAVGGSPSILAAFEAEGHLVLGAPAKEVLPALAGWASRPGWVGERMSLFRAVTSLK